MPVLDWLGKDKVINHHLDVPFRFLDKKFSIGNSDNKIIHGDNLFVLKSLLPEFAGRVKCIYIDPPYNTGNEGWIYNDNVNDAQIRRWLGQIVGKEGEDLTRHDKWLCMMYPRLRLLQKLLSNDGAIFISIDDNELANLKLVCDEIFGAQNFLANISWEKRYTRSNNARMFYSIKDSIIVYRKSDKLSVIKEPRTAKANANYSNPDNDPRGAWMTSSYVNPATKDKRPNLVYEIEAPDGRKINHPTHAWKFSYDEHLRHKNENRLWWGADGTAVYPRLKNFLSEMPGMVPVDLWHYQDAGTTDEGGNTLKQIFGTLPFDTPKPTRLLEKILKLSTDKDSIVLDAFAGSGTTAHAVINLNTQDGSNRKFILIELNDYAETITATRVERVGGEFNFYELGATLFDEDGFINSAVTREQLFDYVYFAETHKHYEPADEENLLGVDDETAYYFFGGEELNFNLLAKIRTRAAAYVIYAATCTLADSELDEFHITFKKIPTDILRI